MRQGPRTTGDARLRPSQPQDAALDLRWPWWVHPAWALLLLTGSTMLVAVWLSPETYRTAWHEPKFLNGFYTGRLVLALMVTLVGIAVTSGMAARSATVQLRITSVQIAYLRRTYAVLGVLAALGYVAWVASALSQGVGWSDVTAVVGRQAGAISALKANARPIAGLTTVTQFGPVAIAVGCLLRRIGHAGRWHWWLVALACVRGLFYAERLAVIEVVLPVLVVAALTVSPEAGRRRRTLTRLGPLVAVPGLWLVFAVSEYTRSWVYYQHFTDSSFPTWVSLRLLGYYATSFNNSALLAEARHGLAAPPYFTVDAFWSAPGVSAVVTPPDLSDWWAQTLGRYSNPEFNNVGSFLATYAEWGTVGMLVIWAVVGLVLGAIFSSLSKGSVPGLLAYSTLFVGVLELPRFTYWSLGRTTPVLLALVVIALTYPRSRTGAARVPVTSPV